MPQGEQEIRELEVGGQWEGERQRHVSLALIEGKVKFKYLKFCWKKAWREYFKDQVWIPIEFDKVYIKVGTKKEYIFPIQEEDYNDLLDK